MFRRVSLNEKRVLSSWLGICGKCWWNEMFQPSKFLSCSRWKWIDKFDRLDYARCFSEMRKKVCVRSLQRDVTCLKEFVFDFRGVLEDSFSFLVDWNFFLFLCWRFMERSKRKFANPSEITILLLRVSWHTRDVEKFSKFNCFRRVKKVRNNVRERIIFFCMFGNKENE